MNSFFLENGSKCLREHIPLKQGLRRLSDTQETVLSLSQRAYSIKTRIKTKPCLKSKIVINAQRAYSIKTRIKTQIGALLFEKLALLREHIPLKQGLRRLGYEPVVLLVDSQRAYSIKTRIKTICSRPHL